MIGKANTKPLITSYPTQLSFDHEIPHKNFKEEYEFSKEIKFEPVTPSFSQKAIVTPSYQVPKPSIKSVMTSTSTMKMNPSRIEHLQKENAQLIQCLVEHEILDRHLNHDNVVLQTMVNYVQRLVVQMTTTNQSLRM